MNTKLTLSLDKDIIEHAKGYAQEKNTSLSVLVENYFKSLAVEGNTSQFRPSPLVQELSGIVQLDEGIDLKGEYTSYLKKKYGQE